jgi:MFS family permease
MTKDILLDPLKMGYLFSGFSSAYVLGQLPSGGLLDRFGSKRVIGVVIPARFPIRLNSAPLRPTIVIGYLVKKTGSFDDVLIFVGVTALCAIVSYGPLVGEIKRLDLKPQLPAPS